MTVSRKQVAESSLPCYRMSQLLRGEIGWFLLWFHLTVSQRIRQATLFEKDFVSKWKKKPKPCISDIIWQAWKEPGGLLFNRIAGFLPLKENCAQGKRD